MKPKLDAEELEILETLESGALKPLADAKALMKQHRDAAVATIQKAAGSTSAFRPKTSVHCKNAP